MIFSVLEKYANPHSFWENSFGKLNGPQNYQYFNSFSISSPPYKLLLNLCSNFFRSLPPPSLSRSLSLMTPYRYTPCIVDSLALASSPSLLLSFVCLCRTLLLFLSGNAELHSIIRKYPIIRIIFGRRWNHIWSFSSNKTHEQMMLLCVSTHFWKLSTNFQLIPMIIHFRDGTIYFYEIGTRWKIFAPAAMTLF